MTLTAMGTASGFVACLVVVGITIHRHRRFELTDIGSFGAAFLSGANLPAALFLCFYSFAPDPPDVATKLHGLERYVSFAGLSLLLVSLISLWGLCRRAHEPSAKAGPAAATPSAAAAPLPEGLGNGALNP